MALPLAYSSACSHSCACSRDIDDLAVGLFAQLSMQYGNVSVYTNASAIKTMLTNQYFIATSTYQAQGCMPISHFSTPDVMPCCVTYVLLELR